MKERSQKLPAYAELHCLSNFSFLRGASHPGELVEQAAALGYRALALTDECSLAGVVRAHIAAKQCGIKLIIGAEFHLDEGLYLALLAPDKRAYSELSALISRARLNSPKGEYQINLKALTHTTRHCLALWLPPFEQGALEQVRHYGDHLKTLFDSRLWLGFQRLHRQGEQLFYERVLALAEQFDLPIVACGSVLMHQRERKPLQDTLTAIRLNKPIQSLGTELLANSEHYLRERSCLVRLYPPDLLSETLRIAERCHFSLDELRYQYPDEVVPEGRSATDFLRELSEAGARQRWPDGVPETVTRLLEHELQLISELRYEHYFLTVYDIVQFARSQNILCQGRGSAANSAVCYCLFITEVDPSRGQLLFERFMSRERDEAPDIDVDFEHERREEVIQYIYRKYGRDRAALAATVITYQMRSAVRDVGKALGFDETLISQLSKSLAWWDKRDALLQRLQELGLQGQTANLFYSLVQQIYGFPRHLSQHVGGFVISRDPLATLVPLENAAMAERTIIQWDKEDLEAMHLMKVDVLALGMLSSIRKSLAMLSQQQGHPFTLQDIPAEDQATYDMLCQADSVGVFQIESRAQMTMLPRLAPRCFYDLVIQIAIVRPGPIQGDMVNPYLLRRQGLEKVVYENEGIKKVLGRTLGVPIFQEQVIQLAMVAAGFSGGEADQLRRAMASWGRNGQLLIFRDKLIEGMKKNGYSEAFSERLFNQMKGFGAYGFPESHSASFALLAYASAWLKCHHPAAFFAGLLNSQPMGFYSPSQLIQDARRHGVTVLPYCVNHSHWDYTLENLHTAKPQLRMGLRQVKGFNQIAAQRIVDNRQSKPYASLADFLARVPLNKLERNALTRADVFASFKLHRHQSQWQVSASEQNDAFLPAAQDLDDGVTLPAPSEIAEVRADYSFSRLSLRRHPLALLRERPRFKGCRQAKELPYIDNGRFIRLAGLVTCRQRPGTASGVLFLTLEDETGNSNIVVWKQVQVQCRQAILGGRLVIVKGLVQRSAPPKREGFSTPPVIHVVALHIEDATSELALEVASHDFH
ncbi:error-prone DNA polymerase [Litorivivens lipolytica]|uniref:Error-prone DNA polymerase n=1 Tax=Litorivivens lipolytica TaxID=1524264 RepID=A0A7W4W4A3_9GAMM|nr:error-prone DNA polymerase [Litorivivens lipolytica]MBB3046617.1 error-prone DNA polymerase [Litorivivens lipolytica]